MYKYFNSLLVRLSNPLVRGFYLLCILGILGFGTCQLAVAGSLKIGFVNAEKVLKEAPQAEQARKDLEKEFAPRDKKLVAMQKKGQTLEKKFSRDSAIMSNNERKRLKKQIRDLARDMERAKEEFREDFNLRRNEELAKLQKDIFKAIRDLARAEKYDLILSDGVIYASNKADITKKVLSRLKSLK